PAPHQLPSFPTRRSSDLREPEDDVPRRVAEVPPEERRLALLGIIGEAPGMTETELTTHTARFFGWRRLSPNIKNAFAQDLLKLQDRKSTRLNSSHVKISY